MYLQFAWRYFNAKKSTNAINIIAWVSMVAIVFITASFIIVLSVLQEGLFLNNHRIILHPADGRQAF